MQRETKYIIVCGGVASGIGKGITISSIAYLMKSSGYNVSLIKIDPYLNIDAGTMSPFEHGEVFVLEDGGEVDLDLGNYERFIDINFSFKHNITSGKIYQKILEKERKGDYLGKTVQFIPHVTNEIKNWITEVSELPVNNTKPDVTLVEIGGTVGDLESASFYESVRQLITEKGKENICLVLVAYVPQFSSGEQKTKPAQNAIKDLRLTGLVPDFCILRSKDQMSQNDIKKIGLTANLYDDYVINVPDVENLFCIPHALEEQNFTSLVMQRLQVPIRKPKTEIFTKYLRYHEEVLNKSKVVTIAVVGKYTDYKDAYLSLIKALESASFHAAVRLEIEWIESIDLQEDPTKNKDPEVYETAWKQLHNADGILIAGGYGERGFQGKLNAAEYARTNKKPTLGICFGFQAMVVEFARNVMNLKDAQTQEFQDIYKSNNYVIMFMPDSSMSTLGGTMRKGAKKTLITNKESMAFKIQGKTEIYERYRHRFEVNPDYIEQFTKSGMIFTGTDETGKRMEILEIKGHQFYHGTQYHPEFQSRHFKPSLDYYAFILAASGNLEKKLSENKNNLKIDYSWNK